MFDFEILESFINIISEYGVLTLIAAIFFLIVFRTIKQNDELTKRMNDDINKKLDDINKKLDDTSETVDSVKTRQEMQFETLKKINDHMDIYEKHIDDMKKKISEMHKKN